ncbi:MAG: sulfotransferase family protein [Candidatus Hodarchaeota archaeon]
MTKTVIVLGMHRSGTSMISGVLSILGLNIGDIIKGRYEYNPFGYFEDQNFLKLNNEILKSAGGHPFDPPDEKSILIQAEKFKEEIEKILKNKPELWGWKDPRTSLTIELYLPYLTNAYFIVCHRKPEEVAESLYRKYKMDFEKSLKIKKIYDLRIENFFSKFPELKRIDLYYNKIIENPMESLKKIGDFLNIEITDKQYKESLKFILPNKKIRKISRRIKRKTKIKKLLKKFKIISN